MARLQSPDQNFMPLPFLQLIAVFACFCSKREVKKRFLEQVELHNLICFASALTLVSPSSK
jgi:hypothetical protein